MKIIKLESDRIADAKNLVFGVFGRGMDLPERTSFWVYKHKDKLLAKLLMKVFGYTELLEYYVAVDHNNHICGTTGFYSNKEDEDEAIWLSWFCVGPAYRGRGIAKQLIEFSIEEAKRRGYKYFRLYTSNDPGEVNAQFLYEKYGFKITGEEQKNGHTIFYREKLLK